MARKPREEPSGDSWMNTYSDLVTLLMTFFVLLFSMSSVNAEKWEMFVEALSKTGAETSQIVIADDPEHGDAPVENSHTGEPESGLNPADPTEESSVPEDFDDLFAFLQKYVEENNLSDSIEVMKDGDSVVYIRFRNSIFFEPDKSVLRQEAYTILGFLGDCLYSVQDDIYLISINGHTADVGNEDYAVSDWQLSSMRASVVADYFDSQKDIDATKLRPMGYGRSYPIADNSTAEGRQQNRRVDMTIMRNVDDPEGESRLEKQLASLFDPSQFPKTGGATDVMDSADSTELDLSEEGVSEALEELLSSAESATEPPVESTPAPDAADTPTSQDTQIPNVPFAPEEDSTAEQPPGEETADDTPAQ